MYTPTKSKRNEKLSENSFWKKVCSHDSNPLSWGIVSTNTKGLFGICGRIIREDTHIFAPPFHLRLWPQWPKASSWMMAAKAKEQSVAHLFWFLLEQFYAFCQWQLQIQGFGTTGPDHKMANAARAKLSSFCLLQSAHMLSKPRFFWTTKKIFTTSGSSEKGNRQKILLLFCQIYPTELT